jgi:hypothetical protein
MAVASRKLQPPLRIIHPRLVLCIRNDGYPASIEPRKVYKALPDAKAGADGLIRVIDESGEDYLYPAKFFAPIRLATAVQRDLLKSA